MATANEISARAVPAPTPDEGWVADLTSDGVSGAAAVRRLHDILLRASRHQVWRLRSLLPGAGADELEDLAQQCADEAVVAVLRQLSTFEGRSRFTTWAYKFAIYQAGAEVRRQAWRHREIHLPDHVQLVDRGSSPAAVTEAALLARAVEAAIATVLTPHQRQITLALVVDEVPIDVLAERLGTTRNALYKTLHDARRRLRAELVAGGHLDPLPDRSDT
jgi:RNA polymerase sigma-70 factor (ECF subfamily)